jgi:predicted MPP superfamily phosphohydrolase
MVTVDGLQIAGVHDAETQDPKLFRAVLQKLKLDGRHASILLAHQPGRLPVAAAAGISLQLSGHTHGGQIWPWNWVAARVHGRFAYGLNRHEALQVLTSSGAGTWGPPLRVGTKAELVLIQFASASAA